MDRIDIESKERQKVVDPWQNQENTVKEIKNRHQPVDYTQVVADNRVLFLGENHRNHSIRRHLVQHARELKKAGITHYAIEANEGGNTIFEKLNRGESVDLSQVDVGPGRTDYEDAIRALAALGIKVVAIDIDQRSRPSREEREARLTENINRILQENPNSRVAVLIGDSHTLRHHVSEGVPSVGKRLMEAQVPIVNIYFTGGKSLIPKLITSAVSRAGLDNHEFMLDFRPYTNLDGTPFGKGEADWVICLPQQSSY